MPNLTGETESPDIVRDLLIRLGAKWAVLTAMLSHMHKKGIDVPSAVNEALKMSRVKIESGCYSPCEVTCTLVEAEGRLFAQGHLLGDQEFMKWSDLLGEAMQGKLDYERIMGIPALKPVRNDCGFLACACSSN